MTLESGPCCDFPHNGGIAPPRSWFVIEMIVMLPSQYLGSIALLLGVAVIVGACAGRTIPSAEGSWRAIKCDSAVDAAANASDEPGFSKAGWKTDFGKHCVPLSEITSGGPPRDGIPPLDHPQFVAPAQADAWLRPQEPVIALTRGGVARAYPLQILIWHEIVNDVIADLPVAVTFCPLCNLSLVFDRRAGGQELTFGTSGNLRFSDLVMWDRQTESWWQQATGEAIVGDLTGTHLMRVPSAVLSYEEFKRTYPEGGVLSRDGAAAETQAKTGSSRSYGANPYVGYDRADSPPIQSFFADRTVDKRLPPKARVAVATFATPPVAYVLDGLEHAIAVNDTIGKRPVVLLYLAGAASPLDTSATAAGADVGQAVLYDPVVEGRTLTFVGGRAKTFTDRETGSTWLVGGLAVAGPLAGKLLVPLDHEVTYWFIWSVFRPDSEVRRPSSQ